MNTITNVRIYIRDIGSEIATPIRFAAEELKKYFRQMNSSYMTDLVPITSEIPLNDNGIWIGMSPEWTALLPKVEDPKYDDAIYIDIKNGKGIITGTNPRSVLIAVYRFLRELGCAFIRPGPDGEVIPKCDPLKQAVSVCEAASYRHRGAGLPFAHQQFLMEWVDWLPKAGMNAYLPLGGRVTHRCMMQWYNGHGNDMREHVPTTKEEGAAMHTMIEQEVARRGVLYHTGGHAWTCVEAFHVNDIDNWQRGKTKPCPEYEQYLAIYDGERKVTSYPNDANLCYSMPYVRESMTDAVVKYCQEHPQVDYLHFWLADGTNNHCECENCQKMTAADWYVALLNELDEKLEAAGIDTRIVFLLYVDLLWEPQQLKIKNPDRFVLMFAPITRSYSSSFSLDPTVDMDKVDAELEPYTRNRLKMPSDVAINVARLRRWQKSFDGDSFDFDYHGFWAHFHDMSGLEISRIMYEDMRELRTIGLNGMAHCQVARNWMPSGLLNHTMAETLWNRDVNFEQLVNRHFADYFGGEENGAKVLEFLRELDGRMPTYYNAKREDDRRMTAARFATARELCKQFEPIIDEQLARTDLDPALRLSWTYLSYFVREYAPVSADAYVALYQDDKEGIVARGNDMIDLVRTMEGVYPACSDAAIFTETMNHYFEGTKPSNHI